MPNKRSRLLTLGLLGGSSASAFSPLSITGLALWLDASDASTLFQASNGTTPATADTNPIGYWGDKSGNGRNVTQATAGKKPLLKTAIQNGKNVVRFDGTDDALTGGDTLDIRTYSQATFVVGAGGASGNGIYISKAIAGAQDGRWAVGYISFELYSVYTNGGSPFANTPRAGGSWEIVAGVIDRAGNNALYANAVSLTSTAFGAETTDWNTATLMNVGAYRNATNTDDAIWLNGDIAEILVYQSAAVLTPANIAAVFAYLNAKWSIF
jgi:hypothetical protein